MHCVLFDIDGTLLLSANAGRHAIEATLKQVFSIAQPAIVPIHGQTDRGIAQSLFTAHNIENSELNWQRFRSDYLERLPKSLEQYGGEVLPGCHEILSHLQGSDDITLGLLTGNIKAAASLKLSHYGLNRHFSSDDLDAFGGLGGFGDVHPNRDDVAQAAIESFAVRTEAVPDLAKTWVIGDTPNDISCARSVGANVLAVATGSYSIAQLTKCQPDACIADMSDWQAVLEIILG